MAYAYVGSGNYYNAGSGTGTITYSPTVGNTLIVIMLGNGPITGWTISDGHNTYNYLSQVQVGGSSYCMVWWVNVTTGGSLTIGFSGANGIYGFYVSEYSGLATSPYIAGSLQITSLAGPGVGANVITTPSNPNVTNVPAMLWGFSVDYEALTGPTTDLGPLVGTTFAYNSHTVGWLGSGSQQVALAEDFRITTTGTDAITFGCSGTTNAQYNTFPVVALAMMEPPVGASVAWWV